MFQGIVGGKRTRGKAALECGDSSPLSFSQASRCFGAGDSLHGESTSRQSGNELPHSKDASQGFLQSTCENLQWQGNLEPL